MSDYCVRLIDLPPHVKGLVQFDETGFANVYINARLSYVEQKKTFKHELKHIRNDDAYNDDDIYSVEGSEAQCRRGMM